MLRALDLIDREGATTLEVRPEAVAREDADIQARMATSVWTTGGCASWYLDKHGNNTTLWPGFTFDFRRQTRTFDLDAYETTARRIAPVKETTPA